MDVQETVAAPVVEEPTPLPEAPSIADHASQFSKEAQATQADETPEEKEARLHHSAQQKREKETGKFEPGKKRSHKDSARPEDVPRIHKLTSEKNAALDRVASLEAEVTRLKTQHAPPAQIAKAEAKVEAASDPEPKEDDPKFAGDYGKFLRAAAAWEGREAYRNEKKAERDAVTKTQKEETERAALKSWGDRVTAAKAKYADFEAVAFGPTVIPDGSAIDAWIMEHKAGADVLYYLQSHRQELDGLLTKPVLEQLEDLTLLSQRLLSTPSGQAGTTGSAAGPKSISQPPRPPNPVRTEAQRATDSPPPTDGSLSIAEHKKAFGTRR